MPCRDIKYNPFGAERELYGGDLRENVDFPDLIKKINDIPANFS
jgi:hypothetical protein